MKKNIRLFTFIIVCLSTLVACGPAKNPEVTLKSIQFSSIPTKLTYYVDECFDTTGLKINKVMSDGSKIEVTDYKYEPSGKLTLEDKQITISYLDKELKINIKVIEGKNPQEEPSTHFILDNRGNFGGSLNASAYGEGAPLNGEHDIKDSLYYHSIDWYDQTSTKTRTLISKLMPYQQIMRDSSGLACAVAALNFDGKDVLNQYSEEALLRKYETLNNVKVFGKGCTSAGLKKVFQDIGYEVDNTPAKIKEATTKAKRTNAAQDFIKTNLEAGKFVFVTYQGGNDYQWYLVIGYDDMGTSDNFDDAVILMDPNDRLDHFQDGYMVITLARLARWWMKVEISNGGVQNQGEALVVTPKNKITFERFTDVKPIYEQTIYPKHLLPGGKNTTVDPNLPENETKLLGSANDLINTPYFHSVDVYNLKNTTSRHISENFRPYLQTYSSSCALVSLMVIMNFYGEDIKTKYTEDNIVKDYQDLNLGGESIEGHGTGASGRLKLLEQYGFKTEKNPGSTSSSKYLKTYGQFKDFVISHIDQGVPIPLGMQPIGGHGVVIIGLDDMGTDYEYDDVIFVADSSDNWDHIIDGYNVYPANTFYHQWYGGLDDSVYTQSFNVFYPKTKLD